MIFLSISWPNLANSSAIWMLPTEPKIVPVELTLVAIVKEVGSYKAIVKLHKEVSVEIPFEVVAEEA